METRIKKTGSFIPRIYVSDKVYYPEREGSANKRVSYWYQIFVPGRFILVHEPSGIISIIKNPDRLENEISNIANKTKRYERRFIPGGKEKIKEAEEIINYFTNGREKSEIEMLEGFRKMICLIRDRKFWMYEN